MNRMDRFLGQQARSQCLHARGDHIRSPASYLAPRAVLGLGPGQGRFAGRTAESGPPPKLSLRL